MRLDWMRDEPIGPQILTSKLGGLICDKGYTVAALWYVFMGVFSCVEMFGKSVIILKT